MNEAIKKTIENLNKNNMNAFYFETAEEAVEKALSLIDKSSLIGMGGSLTLKQIGLIDKLKQENYNLIDTANASEDEKKKLLRKTFSSNIFLTSTNALTQDGKLVNKDGRGNRLSALIYGPDKVIVITGKNKIVKDTKAGLERIEKIAAPLNAKRINKKTPCVETGKCMDCDSPDRICRHTVITEKQSDDKRINVIIIGDDYGL